MNFKERFEVGQQLLMERQVPNVEHGNNLHALLRLLGVLIPPPYFSGFGFNLAVYGIAYAIPCGLLAWYGAQTLMDFFGTFWSLLPFAGVLGVLKAWHYAKLRKKHHLPVWSELHRPATVFD